MVAVACMALSGMVGNELVIAHPHGPMDLAELIVMVGAPVAYLLGNGLYKRIVYGRFPLSHIAGLLAALALIAIASKLDLLTMNVLTSIVIIGVAAFDTRTSRARRKTRQPAPSP